MIITLDGDLEAFPVMKQLYATLKGNKILKKV